MSWFLFEFWHSSCHSSWPDSDCIKEHIMKRQNFLLHSVSCFFYFFFFLLSFPIRWHFKRLLFVPSYGWAHHAAVTRWTEQEGCAPSYAHRPAWRFTIVFHSFEWISCEITTCATPFLKKKNCQTQITHLGIFFSITSPVLVREKLSFRGGATWSLYNKRGGSGKMKAVLSGAKRTRGC